MSNDTKQQSNDVKPQLTRIALDAVWFPADEPQDFAGGNAIAPMLNFGTAKQKGRQYFLGYFVPSYQVVDIEWYRKEGDEPEYYSVPMSAVKKMKRSPKK